MSTETIDFEQFQIVNGQDEMESVMHEHNSKQQQAFEAQHEVMTVMEHEGINGLLSKLSTEQLAHAFAPVAYSECMDERIPLSATHQTAGSSLLRGKTEAIREWRLAGVKTVTAHQGCGAAKAYCAGLSQEVENPDQYAAETLRSWANEAGLAFRFISESDMTDSLDFHPARGLVVDATNRLNCTRIDSSLKLFRLTGSDARNTNGQLQTTSDILLAWNGIVNGPHGMGQWITADAPFVISLTGVTQDEGTLSIMAQEFAEAVNHDPRVQIRVDILSPKIQNILLDQNTKDEQLLAAD